MLLVSRPGPAKTVAGVGGAWLWLGLRHSTPGFKVGMIVLGAVAVYIAVRAFIAL